MDQSHERDNDKLTKPRPWKDEMPVLRVVGAGCPRAGTASLQWALNKVGCGPCNHHYQVLQHDHKDLWSRIYEAFRKGELVQGAMLLKRALHEHDAHAVRRHLQECS